jgi:uncharacterized damage-inducible protein DinB
MTNYSPLPETTVDTLQQLIDLLLQLEPPLYTQPLPVLSGSTLGQHVRHIAEFYLCLFSGISAGQVDYDARKRNLLLETDTGYARQILEDIIRQVQGVEEDRDLHLKVCYQPQNALLVPTTLYRELIYNLEHSIHHLATIRIGVSACGSTCRLPQNFGVAPSTLHYRQQSTCAQ